MERCEPNEAQKDSDTKRNGVYYISLPKRAAIGLIRLYQRTLSPDHGPLSGNPLIGCRYYPSCSEYAARAIEHRGLLIGMIFATWRILRCNPFSPGGVDESYKKKT